MQQPSEQVFTNQEEKNSVGFPSVIKQEERNDHPLRNADAEMWLSGLTPAVQTGNIFYKNYQSRQ